jgi:hypothetical protein
MRGRKLRSSGVESEGLRVMRVEKEVEGEGFRRYDS